MTTIAASILAADFARLGEQVNAVEAAGVDWLHVDVMDGRFVPNITIGPPVVESLRKQTSLPLDVHLMIENPERYIEDFARAGANWISVHQEACPHLHAVIQQIRRYDVHPAVVVNPATPLCLVEPVLADVDMLLVMSVNPGFGGQPFIDSALDKLRLARQWQQERHPGLRIEVDGGVKTANIGRVARAGADVFVVGTGIFQTEDYAATITELRRRSEPVAPVASANAATAG